MCFTIFPLCSFRWMRKKEKSFCFLLPSATIPRARFWGIESTEKKKEARKEEAWRKLWVKDDDKLTCFSPSGILNAEQERRKKKLNIFDKSSDFGALIYLRCHAYDAGVRRYLLSNRIILLQLSNFLLRCFMLISAFRVYGGVGNWTHDLVKVSLLKGKRASKYDFHGSCYWRDSYREFFFIIMLWVFLDLLLCEI